MKFSIISYFIGEGFKNVLKNKKSTFACLGVMCATMIMFGLFFAIGENIDHMLTEIESSQGMQVFLLNEATDEEVEKFGEELKKIEGVNTIKPMSKEDAYNDMKTRLGDKEGVMEATTPDVFSASYIVTLTDLSLNNSVQEQIRNLDNLKRITSSNDTINKLANIGKWIRIITLAILIILILISVFIIANTIKLTVHARRKEISIMKYVGATNNFIRSPFIVEGIVIGLLAGLLSLLLISGLYNIIVNKIIQMDQIENIQVSLLSFTDLFKEIIIVYIILGVGIGIVGSSISMKRYLEV